MKTRIITAIVALAILVPILVFSDTVVFQLAMSILAAVGVWEILSCLGYSKKCAVSAPCIIVAAILPVASYFFSGTRRLSFVVYVAVFAIAFIALMFYLFAYAVFRKGEEKFGDIASTLVFVFYIICGFSSLGAVRRIDGMGQYLYLLPFIGAWLTDTCAYFTGVFLGKHKLCPEISPKKTIEGAIGGIVGASLSFVAYGAILHAVYNIVPNYIALAIAGILISAVSQLGDLIASLIKRERGIKDYGKVFPGHGGVLDRFDSVIAVSIIVLVLSLMPDGMSLFV